MTRILLISVFLLSATAAFAQTEDKEESPCALVLPSAFTPNGDEENDTFVVNSPCELQSFSIQIYNRWGNVVFESDDLENSWDGMAKKEESPSGVYVYHLEYTLIDGTEHELNGSVVLVR